MGFFEPLIGTDETYGVALTWSVTKQPLGNGDAHDTPYLVHPALHTLADFGTDRRPDVGVAQSAFADCVHDVVCESVSFVGAYADPCHDAQNGVDAAAPQRADVKR